MGNSLHFLGMVFYYFFKKKDKAYENLVHDCLHFRSRFFGRHNR
jgi:hypothetical protein